MHYCTPDREHENSRIGRGTAGPIRSVGRTAIEDGSVEAVSESRYAASDRPVVGPRADTGGSTE